MNAKPKPKDISWLVFFLYMLFFYACMMAVYYFFQYISAPALAYDKKVNQQSLQIQK